MDTSRIITLLLILVAFGFSGCHKENLVVQRPERIVSLREVMYNTETYAKLDSLWENYYKAYPSEEAYANWMYAARYADAANYHDGSLLEAGLKLYPANPKLLYLKSMLNHGQPQNLEAIGLLERAVELDPSYTDPWFALAINYMENGEQEKMNVALRKILEAGVIADEVMDFSYNMLAGLNKNAILVTNGDNDTYPVWILTRIIGYRPDVRLVNMSLLNTNWYPHALDTQGVPNLISAKSLDSLSAAFGQYIKEGKITDAQRTPFSDLLIERLVNACRNAGRPVYFAATVQHSNVVKQLLATGRELGVVTLVTPPDETDASQMRKIVTVWLQDFRTTGLDSWALRYSKQSRAGKMLVQNYGAALRSQMDRIIALAPDSRLRLFRWYCDHLVALIPVSNRENLDRMWCRSDDIKEIKDWCQKMNLSK